MRITTAVPVTKIVNMAVDVRLLSFTIRPPFIEVSLQAIDDSGADMVEVPPIRHSIDDSSGIITNLIFNSIVPDTAESRKLKIEGFKVKDAGSFLISREK